MKVHAIRAAFAAAVALLVVGAWAPARADDQLARGKYLVTAAGKCTDCHGVDFHGTHLGFLAPKLPLKYDAPKIAGLPMFKGSIAAAVTFLETGKTPSGKPAMPPMPEYRFNAADALAIAAYLRSLK